MTLQEQLGYIQQQFLDDCNWKVEVAWDEDTHTFIATDTETKAIVTSQSLREEDIGGDDDSLDFFTAMGRCILSMEIPEDWGEEAEMDETPEGYSL